MSKRRKVVWSAAVLLLLVLAAIGFCVPQWPTSTRHAAPASKQWASASSNALIFTNREELALSQPDPSFEAAAPESGPFDKKLIHSAELALTVRDARAAAEQIRRITEADGGSVSGLEITDGGGSVSATLAARVPASRLGAALAEYKKLAMRTDHEQLSGRDVTREFYDNEAHMRNLQAEEQQYLTLMKQAHTVPDVLEVSGKLSDVRDRIERLQTQIQLMTRDIDMSAVGVSLTQESEARVLGIRWRPAYNAKVAVHDLLAGLGDWSDSMVELVIKLPLILLWTLTVGALLWIVWKIGWAVWPLFKKVMRARPAQPASSSTPASGPGIQTNPA